MKEVFIIDVYEPFTRKICLAIEEKIINDDLFNFYDTLNKSLSWLFSTAAYMPISPRVLTSISPTLMKMIYYYSHLWWKLKSHKEKLLPTFLLRNFRIWTSSYLIKRGSWQISQKCQDESWHGRGNKKWFYPHQCTWNYHLSDWACSSKPINYKSVWCIP